MERIRFLIIFSILLICSSCSYANLLQVSEPTTILSWQSQGMIALARPLPSVASASHNEMPGFLPTLQLVSANDSSWLSIDKEQKIVSVMSGDQAISKLPALGLGDLPVGTYQIVHKQRRPLWYAPDEYYTQRGLSLPPEGAKDRYLKGALGDFVLFIDQETPIHNSPIWCEDVGGIQMQEPDISRLYYMVNVGSKVLVK